MSAAAISHWAKNAGCEVRSAIDETEAARFLIEGGTDLLFLSRLWPIGNALPTLGALKTNFPGIRIVYLPPPSEPREVEALVPLASALGVDAVLYWPIDRAAVLREIEAADAGHISSLNN